MALDIEILEYGDKVELRNGDICVYIREVIDDSRPIILQELNLINIFTGEKHNIHEYKDDLKHDADTKLDIIRFAN